MLTSRGGCDREQRKDRGDSYIWIDSPVKNSLDGSGEAIGDGAESSVEMPESLKKLLPRPSIPGICSLYRAIKRSLSSTTLGLGLAPTQVGGDRHRTVSTPSPSKLRSGSSVSIPSRSGGLGRRPDWTTSVSCTDDNYDHFEMLTSPDKQIRR